MTQKTQVENHYGERISWLRAPVLGANEGIVATASHSLGTRSTMVIHRLPRGRTRMLMDQLPIGRQATSRPYHIACRLARAADPWAA